MTDDIVLRSPTADQLADWIEPLLSAFASDFSDGEFVAERPLLEPERLVNAFIDEQRIGSAGAFSMRLTVPGGARVPVSGVTAVGVRPDHTRRGALRRMMTWLLDDARARGESMAVLWASEAAIYQRFGYGAATISAHFEVERARLVFRSPLPSRDGVSVRMVDVDGLFEVAPRIYDTVAERVPGSLDRRDDRWRNLILSDAEWMRRGNGPTYRAVLDVDGDPRGYVIYRVKSEWSGRGPANVLWIQEVVAIDAEAEQRLWQWLARIDLVGTITGWRVPVPSPLQQWVTEPRRLGLTIADGLWLRFVDVAAALSARTYAGEGSLVLELDDDMIDANAGRWQLTVRADGRATVERTTAEPDLALDIATLSSAYLGAFRFADLARAGRVREIRHGALQRAELLFTASITPFCNTMF